MIANIYRSTPAALIFLGFAGTAQADVTAQQVWDDWRAYLSGTGYSVTADESMSGGTLTVTNVAMSMAMPEGAGDMVITFGEIKFTEAGDGTVTVTIPASMPMTVDVDDPEGESFRMALDYTQTGFEMVVSGDADEMNYAYSADRMGVALDSISAGGETMSPDDARMTISLSDLTGETNMKIDGIRSYAQRGSAGAMAYDLAFRDPESSGRFSMQGESGSFGFEGQATLPETMDPENMNAMLDAGFSAAGTIRTGAGTANVDFVDDESAFQLESTTSGATVVVGLDSESLIYTVNQRGLEMNVTSGDLPFPVAFALTEIGLNFMIPTQAAEEEQDFAFSLTLGDFTMSDMIWGIFDPAGQLPRDPATIALDLSGQAKVLVDFLDPSVAEKLENSDEQPGELTALSLNGLRVSAAGADLTGTGSFTFDNSDTETFDGMPAPDGSVDLRLVGGNALLDKLVAMGMLPQEDAMGARMMMGLFGVPGDAPDTITSKIEVSPDGQIKANGQRLQ